MSPFRFIDEEEFNRAVLGSARPVVVWFSSPGCPPCRKIAPLAEEIAREYAGKADFLRVDVDKYPGLAERLEITSVPTFVFLRAGREVDRLEVLPSREEFTEVMEKL
ncbi:thioredoxin family protein [Candidatus Pyrohabitans sp.]